MIGPKAEIGSSTGWLYNPMSGGPPYGNGNDWFYHNGTEWVNPIGEIKVKCNQSVQQQTKVIYKGVLKTVWVHGTKGLEYFGQQVLVTFFLYFNLKTTIFTKIFAIYICRFPFSK